MPVYACDSGGSEDGEVVERDISKELDGLRKLANDLIRGEVEARRAFIDCVDALTHTGSYSQPKADERRPFTSEERTRLINAIEKYANDIDEYSAKWDNLKSSSETSEKHKQDLLRSLRKDAQKAFLPSLPMDTMRIGKKTVIEKKQRNEQFEALADLSFPALKKLFKDDDKEQDQYLRMQPEKYLANCPDGPGYRRGKHRASKNFKRKKEFDRRKKQIRDEILRFFPEIMMESE